MTSLCPAFDPSPTAVVRKMVAYLVAVDRSEKGFSKTPAKVGEKQAA